MGTDNNTPLTEATYYILLSLIRPNHGYGIMQNAQNLSEGRVRLAAGTLYGALGTMCDKGWIVLLPADGSGRKKEYVLTEKGRQILIREVGRLSKMASEGEAAISMMNEEDR
ncbi:MAG: PadR family transcriptional regulator [Eubacteriales bacterium]|nr:PadR family transcriptional regulator [Eubacteriales bacterium]